MECKKRCSNIFVNDVGDICCDFYDEILDVDQDENGDIFVIRCIECEEDTLYERKENKGDEIKKHLNMIKNNTYIMEKDFNLRLISINNCVSNINRILNNEKE